jgi:hypothetical protein
LQIELRRAYNCEIMLSKVKVPLPELMVSYSLWYSFFSTPYDIHLHINASLMAELNLRFYRVIRVLQFRSEKFKLLVCSFLYK